MRKFGIELEMLAPTGWSRTSLGGSLAFRTQTAERLVAEASVRAIPADYSGRDYSVWQCKYDGSLSTDLSVEVVSPPLTSLDAVRRVCGVLTQHQYRIDRSCGFHVHVDVSDLTPTEQLAVVVRYHLFQRNINATLPRSRARNSYARPIQGAAATVVRKDQDAESRRTLQNFRAERYVTVNCRHLPQRLEFRQAAGTADADKVCGWVTFLQEFIQATVDKVRGNAVAPAARTNRTRTLREGSFAAKAYAQLVVDQPIHISSLASLIGLTFEQTLYATRRLQAAGYPMSTLGEGAMTMVRLSNATPTAAPAPARTVFRADSFAGKLLRTMSASLDIPIAVRALAAMMGITPRQTRYAFRTLRAAGYPIAVVDRTAPLDDNLLLVMRDHTPAGSPQPAAMQPTTNQELELRGQFQDGLSEATVAWLEARRVRFAANREAEVD